VFKHRGKGTARKLVLPVAAAALLTLPASADAGLRSYSGMFDNGGVAKFEMKITDSGARKIVRWRWRDVPINCTSKEDPKRDSGYFEKPWLPVVEASRTFEGHATNGSDTADVEGMFPKNWRHAQGTLKVDKTTTNGTCSTDFQSWQADRLPRN
jgi:hypothetical protein